MEVSNRNAVRPFITKDGSNVREIVAPQNSSLKNQSLAEARLRSQHSTKEHYHIQSEEIYYILEGAGKIKINDETREIKVFDAISIPPGKRHKIWNTGDGSYCRSHGNGKEEIRCTLKAYHTH